ncbi:MAG: RagB/SusD family nutrient uptake outer membrane protein [Prevotella sp.]
MNKISSYIIMALSMLSLASCNDWLDVKPETEVREDDLFKSYKGYKEALAGCYSTMVGRDLYGEKLTMSDIECLANLWNTPSVSYNPALYYLHYHDYEDEYSRSHIKAIYGGLYNVVVQANAIINHIVADPTSIANEDARNIVEGEARAIRAYCQFDILRLFGQMPNNPQKTVSLPYSESNDIYTQPAYYGYNDYAKKVLNDLSIAEEKLGKSDPVLEYSFAELNSQSETPVDELIDDDFLAYRRNRLNYWAVKALKARVYLYIGENANAYKEAKAVIDATLNGRKVVELSSNNDYNENLYATPSECLFALQNRALGDYCIDILGGNADRRVDNQKQLLLTTNNFDKKLFAGANVTSDVRYLKLWERNTASSTGTKYPTVKKYYLSANSSQSGLSMRTQIAIMPMLRLSEMYLIAMETTADLSEANALYKTFMAARNVNITTDIESRESLMATIENEYRLDFYAEGQMFFCYKRLGVASMLFSWENMADDQYVIPLPDTEFDPAER